MAEIQFIDMKNDEIFINLKVTKDEYRILRQSTDELLLLPAGSPSLCISLTTGRLGNSNRVMLPKKVLASEGIKILEKKVPAAIFQMDGNAFLLIRLKESMIGIPSFKEGKNVQD